MKYFENIKNLEELRKEYKKLVKKNHPDMGGSEEEMKIINVEYEKAPSENQKVGRKNGGVNRENAAGI